MYNLSLVEEGMIGLKALHHATRILWHFNIFLLLEKNKYIDLTGL